MHLSDGRPETTASGRRSAVFFQKNKGRRIPSGANRTARFPTSFRLAGETRFEHATYGFGDRYSTVEPLPCAHCIIYDKNYFVKFLQRQTGKNSHFFDAESHLAAIKAFSVPSLSQITITDGAEKVNDGRVKKMNNMRNLIHSAMIALTETRSRRRDMNKTNPS